MVVDADVGVDVAELYARYRLPLVRLAVLLVDDQASAEDVVQEAFIGLHRNRTKLRDTAAAPGYLRASVVNHARTALRRRQSMRRRLHVAEPEQGEAADSSAILADDHNDVLRALRQLPAGQREVLVLRYWADLTEAEIARTLGISRGAVKSQASRGMDKLEVLLGGADR